MNLAFDTSRRLQSGGSSDYGGAASRLPPTPASRVLPSPQRDWLHVASDPPAPSLKQIITAVCSRYSIPVRDLVGGRRNAILIQARHMVCLLASRLTGKATPAIGRAINRDHSTVLHGIAMAEARCDADPAFAAELASVEAAIYAAAAGEYCGGLVSAGTPPHGWALSLNSSHSFAHLFGAGDGVQARSLCGSAFAPPDQIIAAEAWPHCRNCVRVASKRWRQSATVTESGATDTKALA